LAIFPFAGLVFLILSYIVLFEPVLVGSFVDSEMEMSAFVTQADVPQDITDVSILN
jgi:hypothetical protein